VGLGRRGWVWGALYGGNGIILTPGILLSHLRWSGSIFLHRQGKSGNFVVMPVLDQTVKQRRNVINLSVRASGGSGILRNLSLCFSIVYCYNGAQRYEQFLQVGRLYWALISLGLALCLLNASVCSWCYIDIKISFVYFTFYLLVS